MSRTLKDNIGMHIQTLAYLRSTWTCQHSHNQTCGTQGSRHPPISHKSRHDGNVRAVSSGSHSWSPRTAMGQSYRLDRTASVLGACAFHYLCSLRVRTILLPYGVSVEDVAFGFSAWPPFSSSCVPLPSPSPGTASPLSLL